MCISSCQTTKTLFFFDFSLEEKGKTCVSLFFFSYFLLIFLQCHTVWNAFLSFSQSALTRLQCVCVLVLFLPFSLYFAPLPFKEWLEWWAEMKSGPRLGGSWQEPPYALNQLSSLFPGPSVMVGVSMYILSISRLSEVEMVRNTTLLLAQYITM